MASTIKLVRKDTKPVVNVTLTDEFTGAAINVTGATVRLKFRAVGATTIKSTLVMGQSIPAQGKVFIDWTADPTALDTAGAFEAEIEITFGDGTIETVYELLKFSIREDF